MAATAQDTFSVQSTPLNGPAGFASPITPSDSVNLPFVTRGIYVGVAGDITAVMLSGVAVLFKNVPVGTLPIRATRVNATGTAATDMVALW